MLKNSLPTSNKILRVSRSFGKRCKVIITVHSENRSKPVLSADNMQRYWLFKYVVHKAATVLKKLKIWRLGPSGTLRRDVGLLQRNYTAQYPRDSNLHTRCRENLKSHIVNNILINYNTTSNEMYELSNNSCAFVRISNLTYVNGRGFPTSEFLDGDSPRSHCARNACTSSCTFPLKLADLNQNWTNFAVE
jgi:hypothetical protein